MNTPKRKLIISEERNNNVIHLDPKLGNGDTVITADGETSVDQYLDNERSKRIKTETEEIRETQSAEMARDRRKSKKRFGNLRASVPKDKLTDKEIFEKSGYVRHLKGEKMEPVDENGLTESVRDLRHKTESLRRSFEGESRDIWNSTSNIKGQSRTTASQFMVWVMLFTQQIVQTKSQWIARFNEVLKKWNSGKSAVSFTSLQSSTTYTVMKTILDKDFAISSLIYSPEKSSRIPVFGFHPCTLYIKRDHLQIMMLRSKKEEGWKLLERYCTEGDTLYNKCIAEWIGGKIEKLDSDETVDSTINIKKSTDEADNSVRQLVINLQDNMSDKQLGRLYKEIIVTPCKSLV
jgi:hypothetical protein